MAIELSNSDAMFNLAMYYQMTKKDYGQMKKYFLMAIELNYEHAVKICSRYNYFYDDEIKNAILKYNNEHPFSFSITFCGITMTISK